jgi:hypothetical protein
MEKNKSYLKYLIGKIVNDIRADIDLVIALKAKKDDNYEQQMSVYTQIYLDEYRLDIYNKSEIVGGINTNIKDLLGLTVIDTNETNEKAELIFDNGYIFIIDLREEAYPEAMYLQGPNNLFVVWN